MSEEHTAKHGRRGSSTQTKALGGLVAVMIAAAIIALVFVVNGNGTKNDPRAGGQPSDVARNSASPTASASHSPSPTASATQSSPTARPSTSTAPTTSSSARTSAPSAGKIVYYTVRRGDTLTGIGRWFRDHGYLTLYQWNKSIIGRDPNLIYPGQRIIVVAHHVGVARPAASTHRAGR